MSPSTGVSLGDACMLRCRPALLAAGAFLLVASASADPMAPPIVTTQPAIGIVAEPEATTSFTATAFGDPPPSVQWQMASDRNGPWIDIPGATGTTLGVAASEDPGSVFALGHSFRAVFTNAAGTAVSRPTRLVWRAQWMRDLGSDIAEVPLNELTIPGTHDMGTYGITGDSADSTDGQAHGCSVDHDACERWSRAQDPIKDAEHELNEGIRYFDLRVCGADGTLLRTCHGIEAAELREILAQTRAWIDSHPGELVFLDLNHHYLLDPDAEAEQIEEAFALSDGESLLLPPQYCTPGDPDSGTCAGGLTLRRIAQEHLGRVIANFENDDAPGDCVVPVGGACVLYRQPAFDLGFYDRHPLFWGRSPAPPISVQGGGRGQCTPAAAVTSCFGNDPLPGLVLAAVSHALEDRALFSNIDSFFVQFLQTTPDGAYIALNFGSGLLDMAYQSNPFIGPEVFRLGRFRPENLNILALNYYNRTAYGAVQFDFVDEVISFNEYARTAPVVDVSSLVRPAATGWYNAAVLAPHGNKLQVDVRAEDYRLPTGIHDLSCLDSFNPTAPIDFGGIALPFTSVSAWDFLTDGVHELACGAEDGARLGFHGHGNRGAGPSSTPNGTFRVDTTPPEIRCVDAHLLLNQRARLRATVTDATSGPDSTRVSRRISSRHVGTFSASLTAADVAGNATTASCPYTVSYAIHLWYDAARAHKSGRVVAIKIALVDYFGRPFWSRGVTVTAKSVTNAATGAMLEPTPAGRPRLDFHSSGRRYEYDLRTTGYAPGSYTLDFVAGSDSLIHHAPFVIR